MQTILRNLFTALVVCGLMFFGCQGHGHDDHGVHPAEVEPIAGSDLSKITLTERAMQRLDVKTDEVREQAGKKTVPYASLIYDPQGQTWVYTSPQARTFVRAKVDVDEIRGDTAYLKDGPPAGTVVATVAVAEIYGTEFEVGH